MVEGTADIAQATIPTVASARAATAAGTIFDISLYPACLLGLLSRYP